MLEACRVIDNVWSYSWDFVSAQPFTESKAGAGVVMQQ